MSIEAPITHPEFQTHSLNETGTRKVQRVRAQFDEFLTLLDGGSYLFKKSRLHSIVKTKLEEACMFAVKAVASDQSGVSYSFAYGTSAAPAVDVKPAKVQVVGDHLDHLDEVVNSLTQNLRKQADVIERIANRLEKIEGRFAVLGKSLMEAAAVEL